MKWTTLKKKQSKQLGYCVCALDKALQFDDRKALLLYNSEVYITNRANFTLLIAFLRFRLAFRCLVRNRAKRGTKTKTSLSIHHKNCLHANVWLNALANAIMHNVLSALLVEPKRHCLNLGRGGGGEIWCTYEVDTQLSFLTLAKSNN